MAKRIEDLNYYELLEVSPTATSQEIHKAYDRIRRVYEPNSLALYSLLTPEETALIHQRIEDAYRTLVYEDNRRKYDLTLRHRNELAEQSQLPLPQQFFQYESEQPLPSLTEDNIQTPSNTQNQLQPAPVPSAQPAPLQEQSAPMSQFIGEFTGPAIRMLREQKGHSLRNIADMTKVNARYLQYIEEENFSKLPARAYIRGFLMLYAKALNCEPERIANDYMKRYDATMKLQAKK